MRAMSLGEMLGGMSAEPEEPMPLPEAQVMELGAALERYRRRSPFKAGDVITPVSISTFGEHGRPYVVLEVIDPEARVTHYPLDNIGSTAFGYTPDLVLFGYSSPRTAGKVLAESMHFEHYDPTVHREKSQTPAPEEELD